MNSSPEIKIEITHPDGEILEHTFDRMVVKELDLRAAIE